jgi:hypothetical protein
LLCPAISFAASADDTNPKIIIAYGSPVSVGSLLYGTAPSVAQDNIKSWEKEFPLQKAKQLAELAKKDVNYHLKIVEESHCRRPSKEEYEARRARPNAGNILGEESYEEYKRKWEKDWQDKKEAKINALTEARQIYADFIEQHSTAELNAPASAHFTPPPSQ